MSSAGDRLIIAKIHAEQKIDFDMRRQLEKVLDLLDPTDLDGRSYETFEAAFIQVILSGQGRFLSVENAFLKAYCVAEFGIDVAVARPAAELIGWDARDRIAASVRSVTAASIKKQTAKQVKLDTATRAARERAIGAGMRHARGAARSVSQQTARSDSRLGYYRRKTTGTENCAFCLAVEANGAVYSADSGTSAFHDHCNCVIVPAQGGKEVPLQAYQASTRREHLTDADRARTKAWIAEYK